MKRLRKRAATIPARSTPFIPMVMSPKLMGSGEPEAAVTLVIARSASPNGQVARRSVGSASDDIAPAEPIAQA